MVRRGGRLLSPLCFPVRMPLANGSRGDGGAGRRPGKAAELHLHLVAVEHVVLRLLADGTHQVVLAGPPGAPPAISLRAPLLVPQ